MKPSGGRASGGAVSLVARVAPGLAMILGYQRRWLRYDLVAGLSVAAVALPTAIAYAQIIGLEPVVGLYAAILPLIVYCLLGTSRHLIVNPDAATCALIAGTLAPLAGDKPDVLLSLSIVLAFFTGLVCIAAGLLRLGFVADFLSRPILVGFLNGIAIHIFLGQLGKVFGFPMHAHGIIPSLLELLGKLHQTHVPTLVVGLLSIGVMLAGKRFLPRWPAPLLAVIFAVVIVRSLGLDTKGVAVVGKVPAGLPPLAWPEFDPRLIKPLLGGAGRALLSFTNAMVVARSFAAKNGYDVDANREFFALGGSQIAAALSGAFAVSGTESRTAMNHAMGGKSPLAGLVAAGVMAAVLLFFTGPLSYLPIAALGAVLIVAAIGLFDAQAIVQLWRFSRWECGLAIVTTLGVVALDVLDGILLAVGLALLIVLVRTSRPPDAVLGKAPGLIGFHNVEYHAGAETLPGLVLYRFGSPLWFFNSAYFKRRALELAAARPGARWLIVDGAPLTSIDSTGAATLQELAAELRGGASSWDWPTSARTSALCSTAQALPTRLAQQQSSHRSKQPSLPASL